MKKLIYIILFLTCCVFTSCEKDKKSTIEGQFYKDCSQTPIDPVTLKIYGTKSAFLQTIEDEYVGEVRTNEAGNFRFEYDYQKSFDGYKFYNGNDVFFRTGHEDQLKFTAYSSATVKHKIKLLVSRPFTDQDTLFLGAVGNGTVLELTGPFTNNQTILTSIRPNIGFNAGSGSMYKSNGTGEGVFWWGLGDVEFQNVWYNPVYQIPPNQINGIPQNACGQGGDVIIDLRNK